MLKCGGEGPTIRIRGESDKNDIKFKLVKIHTIVYGSHRKK